MGLTQRRLVVFLSLGLAACQGSNDTVLQPDTAAGSGGASGASGQGAPAAASGGTTASAGQAGSAAGSGGRSPAAGSGGAASGGSPAAGSGGAPAAASGGMSAAGSGGMPAGGDGGGAAGEGGAGSGGEGGEGGAGAGGEGGQAGSGAIGAADPECDFTGIWAAKQVTVSEALGLPQSSNNWYYLEFKQSGTNVEVSNHFDCGIEVRGSLTVQISRATLTSLTMHNIQSGRQGTLAKQDGSCSFKMARFWSIRGADEQRFLPNESRDSTESIDQVAASKPLPTASMRDGAIDAENDGTLGVAFQIAGLGTRNSVQRDWTEWFTEPGYEITPSTDWGEDLVVRADFDNEENVLEASSTLLSTSSTPVTGAKHILRLRFLGRDASDPRASEIVKATNVETCFAIQDAFPPEQLE